MKVEKLFLRNFRNIEEATLVPERRLNFLVGSNGQGKTSFIEAIGYLATLRSFRGAKSDEVIRWGQSSAEIYGTLSAQDEENTGQPGGSSADSWQTELKVIFNRISETSASKVALINGKPYRSTAQYLSQRFDSFELGFHSIVFNPADHDLIRGEPAGRRSYLDKVLSAEDVEYLKTLQKYKRILEQRNALLKNERVSRDLLAGFSEPLSLYGSLLTQKRLEWLKRLNLRLNNTAHKIAPRQRELSAFYVSSWVPEIEELCINNKDLQYRHFAGQQAPGSLELLKQAFCLRLSHLEEAELKAGSTLVGPHRDDWSFFLGGQSLKAHGSQGEVRSSLLALKLCEIELFRERTSHRPLFLLDDFSSELDRERREFLLSYLSATDLQVFVTTTEDSTYFGTRFRIEDGRVFSA